MKTIHFNSLLITTCLAMHGVVSAGTIEWNSPPGATNLDSSGSVMDTEFTYELGVFSSGFQPTPSNVAQWAANWHKADSVNRSQRVNAFGSSFRVTSNAAPFTVGAPGWILGKKETANGTEKILFRNNHWSWPRAHVPGSGLSLQREWAVDEKSQMDQVVLGSVTPDGSPVLMRSAVVQSYDEWREAHLADEPLDGPSDDPTGDGVPNILKFALGMDPKDKSQRPSTLIGQVEMENDKFLTMSIPRQGVKLADMQVEVSSDLMTWDKGPAFIEVVSDKQEKLIVRDKTPFSETGGKRFMRLKVDVPK